MPGSGDRVPLACGGFAVADAFCYAGPHALESAVRRPPSPTASELPPTGIGNQRRTLIFEEMWHISVLHAQEYTRDGRKRVLARSQHSV